MQNPIASLFSNGVRVATGPPELARGRLFPEEQALVSGALEARQREFRAGRLYARQALRELGFAPSPILANNRKPIWPPGALGTITHKSGMCGVAVARNDELTGIGLDVEKRDAITVDLHHHVLTERERAWLDSKPPGSHARWATLTFSAKEAFYKSLAEFDLDFVGFHDVRIEHGENDTFDVIIQSKSLDAVLPPIETRGRSFLFEDWIWTAVTLRARA